MLHNTTLLKFNQEQLRRQVSPFRIEMTLRAGLIGAGNIGKFHVQALRRLDDVEIVGVTDLHADRARAFSQDMSVPAFTSISALREAGAQVMHIVTPPASHASLAIEAMSLGCDVFIEKPMATSVEDCDRIQAAVRQYRRTVCVGHSLLYDPFVRRALDLVAGGAIGDVVAFDYFRCMNQQSYPAAGLSPEQQQGGYPFRDIGIHALYLAEAFVGPLQRVEGWPMASGRGDCNLWIDEWRALGHGERGTVQILLSWNVRPQQNVFLVHGTKGIIRADMFGLSVTVRKQYPLPEPATRMLNAIGEGRSMATQALSNVVRVATRRVWQFHGVQALVMEFYRRLAQGQPAPVIPEDAQRVVLWTEQIARQADEMKVEWTASLSRRHSGARTLVTGGGGFIGRSLVRRLLDEGTPLRLLVRRPPSADIAAHPLVELVLGDLSDPAVVDRAVQRMDLVYHVGATMRGSANDFDRGTVAGTRNVLDSAIRHRLRRLVYMSSLAVIDTDAGHTEPITENSALEQNVGDRGHYTRTKLEAEALVLEAVRAHGVSAIILRPGEVVGPEKPLLTSGVAQQAGGSLVVLGNGRVRLPLVHVSDVVDALVAASTADAPSGTIVHLVEDTTVTQNDIIAHYLKTSGRKRRVIRVPMPIVMALASVIEISGKRILGWAPIGRRRVRAATASRRFDCSAAARVLGWQPRMGVADAFAPRGDGARPGASRTAAPPEHDSVTVG
jgi:nucleoside-diphosphate-sugar epimerase/predicted dehydrogenase